MAEWKPHLAENRAIGGSFQAERRLLRKIGAAAGVAVACLAGGGARAQVIDQYLNPDIPGYGTQAGVTVETRGHPEYDQTGVRVGLWTITPTLIEGFGYDDNVTGTSNAKGSPLIETNATVAAAADYGLTKVNASAMVDDNEYLTQAAQTFTNWSVAAGVSQEIDRDTLYVGGTYLNLNQTPKDLDAPDLNSTIAFRVADMRADYRIDLSQAYLLPGVDVSTYNFDNGTAGGLPYLQSYRDRVVVTPTLEAGYEFATRRRVVVVVRDTQSNFSHSVPGIPLETFNDASVLAGVAYDADGVIGFRLLVGYEQRNFSSSAYKQIAAPIVEGAATWTPTELTTVKATVARYIEDSAAEATTGYTETALKLSVDHELYRNIILDAHVAVYLDDYAGGGNQSYYTGGGGVTWRLNRDLSLTADYTFSARQASSSVPAAFAPDDEIFGSDYTDNVFMIRLKAGL